MRKLLIIILASVATIALAQSKIFINGGQSNIGSSSNSFIGFGPSNSSPATHLHLSDSYNGELSLLLQNTYGNGARTFLTSIPNRSLIQTDRDLGIWTNGGGWSEKFTVLNNGYIGIGTVSPNSKLVVAEGNYGISFNPNAAASGIGFNRNALDGAIFNSSISAWQFSARDDRFTLEGYNGPPHDLFTVLKNGDVGIGTVTPRAPLEVAGDMLGAARLKFATANAYDGSYAVLGLSTGVAGKNFVFYNYDGPVNELMTINGTTGTTAINNGGLTVAGNVGIGTTAPDAKLAVKGLIHAQEVEIDLQGAVAPDYVFEKDYPLPSLEQIKSYIDQNKHLPEVPSAKEMEVNGVNLGEMNMILLKKVEELTIYAIEANKKIVEQQKQIDAILKTISKK